MSLYRSLLIENENTGKAVFKEVTVKTQDLPDNDLLINVKYTSLSYKDALAITGKLDRKGAFVPGIDAAGIVVKSRKPEFKPGDEVVVTGFGLGVTVPGGFGQYISVPASWAVHIPIGMSSKHAVILGSAGIASGMCMAEFINNGVKDNVAVTLGTFDYGAVASALFAKAGFNVTAFVEGSADCAGYLSKLGVKDVVDISNLGKISPKKSFSGIFDIYGGSLFSTLTGNLSRNGVAVIADCIEGVSFNASALNIINNELMFKGVDAANCPVKIKEKIWHKYTGEWKLPLDWICTEIALGELQNYLPDILERKVMGRIAVNMQI